MIKRLLALLGAVATVLIGCAPAAYYYDPYYSDYAYYEPYYYYYDTAYVYGWYDPFGYYYFYSSSGQAQTTTDLNAAAQAIAQRVPNYYLPQGCATATASANTVVHNFTDCTGLYSTRKISGQLVLTLSQNGNQLVFKGFSNDFKVDGKPFIVDLTASASTNGNQRVVTINSHSRYPDLTDTRDSTGTMTWTQGSTCFELNAQGTSTHGSITTNSTITGYQQCGGQCPTAGTVTVESPKGQFTTSYNGEPQLFVTSPNGERKQYDLQCTK